jgi:hypothetical protein
MPLIFGRPKSGEMQMASVIESSAVEKLTGRVGDSDPYDYTR